jgi:hypothetical protein
MRPTVLFSIMFAFSMTLSACEPDSNVVMSDNPTKTGVVTTTGSGSTTGTEPTNVSIAFKKQLNISAAPAALTLQSVEFDVSFKNCADRTALVKANATAATLAETSPRSDAWGQNLGQVFGECIMEYYEKSLDYYWSSDAKPPYGQMPAMVIADGETVSLVFELPLIAGVSTEDLTVSGSYSWTDSNGVTQRKLF